MNIEFYVGMLIGGTFGGLIVVGSMYFMTRNLLKKYNLWGLSDCEYDKIKKFSQEIQQNE